MATGDGQHHRRRGGRCGRIAAPLTAVMLLCTAACAGMSHIARDPLTTPAISATTVSLDDGQPFELHLAVPAKPRVPGVLVLYASGDGGWFGSAEDMFRAVGDAGFYGVGLSTRTLLHRRAPAGTPPGLQELARDYRTILDQAAALLHLSADHRVVLSGWSRGASLAVLIGAARHAPRNLAGIVAIGLAADENLNVSSDTDDDPDDADPAGKQLGGMLLYPLLDDVAPGRCAVIQATGDKYLPAAQARVLFGADTTLRRFYEVPAKNHRFGGGAETFAASLRESLDWVASGSPVP